MARIPRSRVAGLRGVEVLDRVQAAGWPTVKGNAGRVSLFAYEAGATIGTLLAVRADVTCNTGAYSVYPWTAGIEALMAGGLLTGPYRLANYDCAVRGVATNTAPAGPYRLKATALGRYMLYGRGHDFLAAGAGDAHRDLAAVGDQDLLHRRSPSKSDRSTVARPPRAARSRALDRERSDRLGGRAQPLWLRRQRPRQLRRSHGHRGRVEARRNGQELASDGRRRPVG